MQIPPLSLLIPKREKRSKQIKSKHIKLNKNLSRLTQLYPEYFPSWRLQCPVSEIHFSSSRSCFPCLSRSLLMLGCNPVALGSRHSFYPKSFNGRPYHISSDTYTPLPCNCSSSRHHSSCPLLHSWTELMMAFHLKKDFQTFMSMDALDEMTSASLGTPPIKEDRCALQQANKFLITELFKCKALW